VPDWPIVPLYAFLTGVALLRAGATYAVGRGARGLAGRRTSLLERPAVQRAEGVVRRFGAPAVTLCFLTVGVQTAVNAAAGSLRMPLRRYLPALLLGALLWAGVYVTVGLAVVAAFWSGGVGRGLLVLALVGVVVGLVLWQARAARDSEVPGQSASQEETPCPSSTTSSRSSSPSGTAVS